MAGTGNEAAALIRLRRDLHRHPEAAWQEYRTTALVERILRDAGLAILRLGDLLPDPGKDAPGCQEYAAQAKDRALAEDAPPEIIRKLRLPGLLAVLDTGRPGPRRGLRCDLDAVPVQEAEDAGHRPFREGFASAHPGISHACGHDGHTALVVHTALRLAARRDSLRGSWVFIFQPAEEGCRGAWALRSLPQIRELDELYGFHLGICARDGEIVSDPDHFLVSTKFDVTIRGLSAHAGIEPEKGINALRCACESALRLFELGSLRPSARFNIGMFSSPNPRNAVADHVTFQCECRDLTEKGNDEILERAREILRETCSRHGCGLDTVITGRAASITNSPTLAAAVARAGAAAGLKEGSNRHFNACEDCGHLIRAVQDAGGEGAYFVIGNSTAAGHHSNRFDLSEESLPQALDLLTCLLTADSNSEAPDQPPQIRG